MQVIIPMTGYGSRFKAAGYEKLKPFIEIEGKPLVEWVLNMFDDQKDEILFICRQEHLDSLSYMKEELERIAPNAKIFSVKEWEKLGPVGDVLKASESISDTDPALVCYCDFYMHWDYRAFKEEVVKRDCAGAIPCYTGFHPHLIPEKNVYATCRVDSEDNLIEIKEKHSWFEDKTKDRHSAGVYYFKTGNVLKKFFKLLMDSKDDLNGEYYASLPYNYLVKEGLKVWCPNNITHFCQWGTPEDMQEYEFWTQTVRGFSK